MKTVQQLRDEIADKNQARAAILAAAKAEDRALSDDDRTKFDELRTEIEALDTEIETLEADAERAADVEKTDEQLKASPGRKTRAGQPTDKPKVTETADKPWATARSSRATIPGFTNDRGLSGDAEREAAYKSGVWLRGVLTGHEESKRQAKEWFGEPRALAGNVNTAGGVLVPDQFEAAVISLREQYGVARRYCDVVTMNSDHMNMPTDTGEVTVYLVGEGAAITASDPSFGNVTLTARKWGTLTRISSELVEDAAIDVASYLATQIARKFAEKEDDCLFNGDGSATYGHIYGLIPQFQANTSLAGYVLAATAAHDTPPEMDIDDLTKAMGLLPVYVTQPKWFTHPKWAAGVFGALRAQGGGNTIDSLSGGLAGAFLGAEIVPCLKSNSTVTTATDRVWALYGDMSMAVKLGTRRGIAIQTLTERYAEYDQIAVKATTRWDINFHGVGDNTNPGPLVALVTDQA